MLIGDGGNWTLLHNISSTRMLPVQLVGVHLPDVTFRIPQLRRYQVQQESKCRVGILTARQPAALIFSS